MAKLSFKRIAVAVLSAMGLSALSVGAAGCLPKSTDLTEPENIEITKLAPPDDGSLPTAHTCAENLAYINYVFGTQTQYHSYSYGVTNASIATQTTRNFRDFKDGVLMNTDLTYSSMVKGGTQTCSMYNQDGEYEVYFRTSQAPEADTLPAQAVWSEEAPTFFNKRAYNYTYGLLPDELFNYIVNEQNIVASEQLKVNSDGTFTQNFTLDPKASTYFYQFGMKTRGGLSGYPDFESINFSVTFDADWRILSSTVHEVAKINKGVIVTSVSDFNTEYWYGEERFDGQHFSYYDSYFKKYLGDDNLEQGGSLDEKPVIDVTNVLSNGFSQIMNGGAQFELAINLGVNRYVGYAFVSLDLADPLESLALKVSLGKTLKDQTLYIEYGEGGMSAYYGKDFALQANLAEVKFAVEQFGGVIDKIKSAFVKDGVVSGQTENSAPSESGGDPLTELMNAMVLTAGEKQAVLTLDTDNLLGMGIGVSLKLVFGINNNKITFRSGSVGNLSLGGEKIDLGVTILTTTAPEIGRDPSQTAGNLAEYIADINSLLGADLLKITANINGGGDKVSIQALKGINANVTAYADLDGVTVGAGAEISYVYNGQTISAKADVWYGYDASQNNYGCAVVRLTEFNGAPLNLSVKCDIKQVADALGTLVTFAGGDQGEGANGLVSLLNKALSSDFSSLLTEMYADKAQIKVGVSIDALMDMLGVNTGVKFGSCTLKYVRGGGIYGGELFASLPALGLNISVVGESGALTVPETEDCFDLVYLIEDVKQLAEADLIKAHIALDGSSEGVTVAQLDGLGADIDVYFNLKNVAVAADIAVSYKYGEQNVSAKLSAWYDKGAEGLGKLVLSLNEINGKPVAAKAYCDIAEIKEAVTALLNYAGIKLAPFGNNGGLQLDGVITSILGADFNELLPVAQTSADGLAVAVNADKLLSILGVNAGVSLGNVSLVYSHAVENKLVAAMPAVGLNVTIGGAAGSLQPMPSPDGCLDLTKLVNTVCAVWEQVDGIISNESVSFEIVKGETFLSLDGIVVEIWGEGEISWKAGGEYVALDLAMAITERATDVLTFNFIYDKNAENKPLVKLALNGVGIEIYREDIDGVKSGFKSVYDKISALLGKDTGGAATGESVNKITDGATLPLSDNLIGVLFGVLASDGWVDALNDITVTCDGKSAALSYLSENAVNIEIGSEGNISLFYDGAFGKRFELSGGIVASATVGSLCDALESKFESCKMSSSKADGSAGFVKLAYDYLFEAVSSVDVSNILGSDTYTVTFKLDGNNTNIPQLKNVYVGAEIYITGENGAQSKLAEADLNINASGINVKLNVITERRGNNTYFYINLSQVADVKIPDLKLTASQQSLYETLEVLFKTVNDTNILNSVGKLIGLGNTQAPAQNDGEADKKAVIDGALSDKLADIISKLLNFDFSKAVIATETDGVTTAVIDLDNIVKQLGVQTGALGTAEAIIYHNTHSMKTSGKTLVTDGKGNSELKEWISLSSQLAPRRDYSKFDRSEYISIEFLPALIEDLVKFATDENGDLHTAFTLSGNVKANLVGMIDVNIDPCTLTVNIGENGMSLSLVMHINKAKVIGIGIPESTVGITYRNGLLTLAKGLNTSSPEYKVMTFDYFLDHMLTKKDSVLNWLLDISGWDLIMSFVKVDVNSGLTSPEDISLFDKTTVKEEQEISMYDFIEALRVVINGNQTAVFGNYTALENDLGVYDNYYGFSLNAGAVTGGVLTKLNAAITRGDSGLDRVLASGAVQSYVTFSANLQYKENWRQEYLLGTALQGDVTAPDLYLSALAKAEENNYIPDFEHFVKKPDLGYDEKFGCLTVSGHSCTEDYSKVLYSHTLTIVNINGEREERLVRHGSTIHLYDNNSPVYTDSTNTVRLIYSVSPMQTGGESAVMNGDLTVYALGRAAVSVIFHNGSEQIVFASFEGDKVPRSVAGLEAVTVPVYENGVEVGANDVIDGSSSEIHVYGTFVKTETVVNFVKYTFSAETMSYTASGKAAGFNDYYSVKGNKLVLENEIGGYPVTAIADKAFANTEGKPVKNVIVPENIVTVGENAFMDNTDMQTAVFLAPTVDFKGNDGNGTFAFYGCNLSSNAEKTQLVIYYNRATANGAESNLWSHFYTSKPAGISYYKYIGIDPNTSEWINYHENGGGALYGAGGWTYTEFDVNLNLNGVSGGKLNKEAVTSILSPYFPYVTAGSYEGSAYEQTVNAALDSGLAAMDFSRGGITYKCVYTAQASTVNGKTVLTYNVTYNKAAEVYVKSSVSVTCYGVNVQPGVVTKIIVPVEGDSIALAAPSSDTHDFIGWRTTEENGVTVYNADWQVKEFSLKIRLTRGGTDTNFVYVGSDSFRINGAGVKGTVDVTTVKIYGGEATFTVSDKVLTIVTNQTTYTVYVNEASVFGKDKNIKRNINCDVNGAVNVTQDMVITLSY